MGAVAGLVCITPAAGFVTPGWALAIGSLGAMWCYASVQLVNKAHLVDDTLDACPCAVKKIIIYIAYK